MCHIFVFEFNSHAFIQVLSDHFMALSRTFDFLAATCDGDGFVIKLNSYTDFCSTIQVTDRESLFTNKGALDTLFGDLEEEVPTMETVEEFKAKEIFWTIQGL